MMSLVSDASYQVLSKSAHWFRGRRFVSVLLYVGMVDKWPSLYGNHVTKIPRINVCSPYSGRLHTNFGFDWPSCFGGEDV